MGVPGCSTSMVVGWEGTTTTVRWPFAVEKSAEAIVVAAAATKGRTQSRGAGPVVLVKSALTAANPSGGLGGDARG